jgi:hypothetical protein
MKNIRGSITHGANMWRLQQDLPTNGETLSDLAKRIAKEKRVKSRTGRMGLEPTERQKANATRADQKLRKFSWETE